MFIMYVVYVFLIGNHDFNNVAAFNIVQTEEEQMARVNKRLFWPQIF